MNNGVDIRRFFPMDSERLFDYFMKPELQEKWAAPSGMTLKLPTFDARPGGAYRYEHTGAEGKYVCEGTFQEIIPQEKIVQLDHFVKNPRGETMYENLESSIEFEPKFGGTEVHIHQSGFDKQEDADGCFEGWTQCLDKLSQFVNQETGFGASGSTPENEQDIQG